MRRRSVGDDHKGHMKYPVIRIMDRAKPVNRVSLAATAIAVVLGTQGCLPQVEHADVNRTYATPGRPLAATTRELDGAPEVSAVAQGTAQGDFIDVTVRRGRQCAHVTRTEMTKEQGTTRSLKNGTLAQITNLAAAAALVAGGVAAYASASCTEPGQCSGPAEDKADGRRTLGLVVAGTAALPTGLFFWNLGRASDDVHVFALDPREDVRPFACASRPAGRAAVGVHLAATESSVATNDGGTARVPIAWGSLGETLPSSAVVTVDLGGGVVGTTTVSLTELAPYRAWAARKHEEEERAAAARRDADNAARAKSAEEHRAQQQTLASIHAWGHAKVHATLSARTFSRETCWNRVDTEVRCDGAAAVRKHVETWNENTVSIVNGASVPLACHVKQLSIGLLSSFFEALGPKTGATAVVPTGATRSIAMRGVASGGDLLTAEDTVMICGSTAEEIAKATQLSAPAVGSLVGGDMSAIVGIVVRFDPRTSTSTVYVMGGRAVYTHEAGGFRRL